MAAEASIRFGVLGCASIARKLSRAILLAPNAELYAVASRSMDKAKAFVASNGFSPHAKIHNNYEALLDDPEIDAVYLPLPTSLHLRWAVLAAMKNKHILLEKPVGLNTAEFDTIVEATESSGVKFMDGTMSMHHPTTALMEDFLSDSNRFGQLKRVNATFTWGADPNFLKNNIRVKPDLDALGVLGDLGGIVSGQSFGLPILNYQKKVIASRGAVHNETGVILDCGASLHWEDGKVATFYCSFLSNMTMSLTAIGRKGTLHVDDFVIPIQEDEAYYSTGTENGFNEGITSWVPQPSKHIIAVDLPQEARMVTEFSNLVRAIKKGAKPEKKWPTLSRKTQLVLDAVKASIDKGFEFVEVGC